MNKFVTLKTMKAKIIKEINPDGSGCFKIYSNDKILKSISFNPNEELQNIWGEEKALNEAKAFALLVEKSKDGQYPLKETIYETPE